MPGLSLNSDPRLSRFVVRVPGPGGEHLYHTVTRESLPVDATETQLAERFFLAGSERAAVEGRLFGSRRSLTLTVIVTWECNLRCNHCTVLGRLVDRQKRDVSVDRLVDFVARYREARAEVEVLKISLLGGEPLLRPALCREIIGRLRSLAPRVEFDTTTNLAVPLETEHLDVLAQLRDIVVSLDGLEQQHNAQRRAYKSAFNPFERTRENLRALVDAGLADKIYVQGAIRDEFATIEAFQDFQRELMSIGVHWNRIAFETLHPAEHRKAPQSSFLASLKTRRLRHEACCKYRGGSKLIVDHDDRLYSDYYTWEPLGTLETEIDELLARHHEMVERSMPALQDPGCLSCPVIGYCWGGCTNAQIVTGSRPSEFCDQEGLMDEVRRRADSGSLVSEEARETKDCPNELG